MLDLNRGCCLDDAWTFPPLRHARRRQEDEALPRERRTDPRRGAGLGGRGSRRAGSSFAEVLKFPAYADRLGARVRKDPAFADLTNDKGQRVVELACFECRAQMQKALFLLGRYAVDKTPPLHFSATAAVLGATDHDKSDVKPRRALKAMRRVDQVLAELDGRAGLDSKFVVAVVAVHVNATVPAVDYKRIQHAARALDGVVVERAEGLGEDLAGLLAARERSDASADRFKGYDCLLVLELAEESLSKKIIHGGVCGVDLVEIRKIARDMAEALDHLHARDRIHADIKPLNVVRVGTTWQLVDLDVSCAIGEPFGTKKPSLGYCPPEMAQTCVEINHRQFLLSHFSAMAWPCWLRRGEDLHAIERCRWLAEDSARTCRKILISTHRSSTRWMPRIGWTRPGSAPTPRILPTTSGPSASCSSTLLRARPCSRQIKMTTCRQKACASWSSAALT